MSNELAVPAYHAQLPAFLRNPSLFDVTDKAIAGIGGGMPARVSIRGAKWRLIDANGEEAMVQQLHLDVIVLGGNEHVSKMFYSKSYDPAAGASVPPDCFSDNGTAPSANAVTPQSALCASCPHNAWGSKITPTGSHVKACADSKKLAVVLASPTPVLIGNAAATLPPFEQIYLLSVPAASMRNFKDFGKMIRGHGAPLIGCVVKLTFDPEQAYPAILFTTERFIDETTFNTVHKMLPRVAEVVGSNDTPRTGAVQEASSPAQIAQAAPAAPAPVAPAPVAAAPRPRGRPPAVQAAPAPVAAAPASMFAPAGNGAVMQAATPSSPDLDALLSKSLGQ